MPTQEEISTAQATLRAAVNAAVLAQQTYISTILSGYQSDTQVSRDTFDSALNSYANNSISRAVLDSAAEVYRNEVSLANTAKDTSLATEDQTMVSALASAQATFQAIFNS